MTKVVQKYQKIIFVAIIFLSFILRFYKLGDMPNGLNRDEASLGYTSYSLLNFSEEEHGVKFPLNIESFGDWKLPVYVYSLIPFIKIFGLNDWVIRIPSALSGILSVIVVYILLIELLEKEKKLSSWLPLMGSLFLAISPWSVHFSRIAYEANLALLFFVLALLLYLKALHIRANLLLLPFSAFFFLVTVFTYHAYQVLTPVFVLFLSFYFLKKNGVGSILKKDVLLSILVFILGSFLFLFAQSAKSNQVKMNGLSIFSSSMYREELFLRRQMTASLISPVFSRIYASTPTLIVEKFIKNIFDICNPKFLFSEGGSHGSHNITGIGNMYALSFLFVLFGLISIFREQKIWQKLILLWLVLASIPALITVEANHSTRFSSAMIPLEIISAYGFGKLIFWSKININHFFIKKFFSAILVLLLFTSFIYYLELYFVVFPQRNEDRWPWYMQKLTSIVADHYNLVDNFYMQGESSSPYIYFLIYQSKLWQNPNRELNFYPTDVEGFRHVSQLGKVHFQSIDWNYLENHGKSIVIVKPKELPGDKVGKDGYTVIDSISNSEGETLYLIISVEGNSLE